MNETERQDRVFLGTEPVGKLMLRLAAPSILAQIINVLYNIVDRIYIGHMPRVGALALTGLGVCAPLLIIVSAFAMLSAMGGAPLASIAMGRGDHARAERILGMCFVLQLLLSALLTAALLLWSRPLLLLFGASANTISYAVQYMNIYALGTVFVQVTLGMNAFITAQGNARTSMLTVLIGAVCNIVLDPVFIFALGMGVRGAALATVLSQGVSCVWVLHFLTTSKSVLRLRRANVRLDRTVLPCIALGASPFIMQASESVLSVCFNASLLRYGGDMAVGAMTILSTVMQFALMPLQGFTQGAQPITSYNYGARNAPRVRKTVRLLLVCCCSYATLLWAAVQLFPGAFAAMFTSDAALVAYTRPALRVYLAVLPLMGAQNACQMTFLSLGNAKTSIFLAVFRKFIMLIPLIYLLPALLPDKVMAVYLAEPLADTAAVLCTLLLFWREFRRTMRALEAGAKPGAAAPQDEARPGTLSV